MRNLEPAGVCESTARELFWPLFSRNYLVEYVPEEYLVDGRAKLADFDVLVLPTAVYLSDDIQSRIVKWQQDGRRLLVAVGPCGLKDELGFPSRKLLDTVFGVGRVPSIQERPTKEFGSWRWHFESSAPAALTAKLAGSEAILITRPVRELIDQPGGLDMVFKGLDRFSARAAHDAKDRFELVLRGDGKNRYLCALNPNLDDEAEGEVAVRGQYGSVVDLDIPGGYPLPARHAGGETLFPLHLAPGQSTILRLEAANN
jgi:hypothetical protein